MFTVAISYLAMSNLPWFMSLIFLVPMQYCSLQHWVLLSPPDTSTVGHHFHFGLASSFLLELFLLSSVVAYWPPTDLGGSSFNFISFCLFMLFMGFLRQECWSGLPFLLHWTMFCQNSPPWPVLLGWPYMAWLIVSWGSKANRVLPREHIGHSKHPLPTTQEKTLHMDITRWSTPKSDWLYSLQRKMEKLYTVSKNKIRSRLWLRSWTPYCQIQT